MPPWLSVVVSVLIAVLGSSGIWAVILEREKRNSAENQLLLGLAHDRIIELCKVYIKRGWITADEYENLHDYLFVPYTARGGNGTAARMMGEVNKLPVKHISYEEQLKE